MGLRGPKPKTNADWKEEVARLAPNGVVCTDDYVTSNTPLTFTHTCGHSWKRSPADWRRSPDCPRCRSLDGHRQVSRPSRFSLKYFQQRLEEVHGARVYTALSSPASNTDKTLVRHDLCGHEWMATPATLIRRHNPSRCPACNPAHQKKLHTEFLQDVHAQAGSQYIVLSEYSGINEYVTMRHEPCGHEWRVTPNKFLLDGTRCPLCVSVRISKRAREVYATLKDAGYQIELEKQFSDGPKSEAGRGLFFDFWLPEFNALVEVDGRQHEEGWWQHRQQGNNAAIQRVQYNDREKDRWAHERGIPLLRLHWRDTTFKETVQQWLISLQA